MGFLFSSYSPLPFFFLRFFFEKKIAFLPSLLHLANNFHAPAPPFSTHTGAIRGSSTATQTSTARTSTSSAPSGGSRTRKRPSCTTSTIWVLATVIFCLSSPAPAPRPLLLRIESSAGKGGKKRKKEKILVLTVPSPQKPNRPDDLPGQENRPHGAVQDPAAVPAQLHARDGRQADARHVRHQGGRVLF